MQSSNQTNKVDSDIQGLLKFKETANSYYLKSLTQELTDDDYKPLQEITSNFNNYVTALANGTFRSEHIISIPSLPKDTNELRDGYKATMSNVDALINYIEVQRLAQNSITIDNSLEFNDSQSQFRNYFDKLSDSLDTRQKKQIILERMAIQERDLRATLKNEFIKVKDELREKSQLLDRTEYTLNQESAKATNLQQNIDILKNNFEAVEKTLKDKNIALEAETAKLKDKKQKEEVVKNSQEFKNQAKISKTIAFSFLAAIVLSLSGFIYFLFHLLSNDYELFNVASGIITKSQKIDPKIYNQLITVEIIKRMGTKLLIFSTIIYGITFLVKNYNAQMHNYIVNSHKANALLSTVNLIGTAREDEGNDKIILQATQAIFTTQKSGYQGAENEPTSPNLITNVIDAVSKKS